MPHFPEHSSFAVPGEQGSGIARARELYPDIDLINDQDGCQFLAIVKRPSARNVQEKKVSLTSRQNEILSLMRKDGGVSIRALSHKLGINVSAVQTHVAVLRAKNVLAREGGTRGRWIVLAPDGEHPNL